MRLTLRTMLAYLDEVLEPGDREELAKKIETSDFANDLIHRTKDTMRRLRLSAPQMIGTGIGLDPNTVAEYLDNVLPPDSVADFERICLESDVHLAEVASCHHVLTMVLGEPAEVDPAARQRMYGIPAEIEQQKRLRLEPAHPSNAAAGRVFGTPVPPPVAAITPMDAIPEVAPHTHDIPDYLRTSMWSAPRTWMIVLAALLLVAVAALLTNGLMGWFSKGHPLTAENSTTAPSGVQPVAPGPSESTMATPPVVPNHPAEQNDPYAVPNSEPANNNASPSATGAPPPLAMPEISPATSSAPPAAAAVPLSPQGFGSTTGSTMTPPVATEPDRYATPSTSEQSAGTAAMPAASSAPAITNANPSMLSGDEQVRVASAGPVAAQTGMDAVPPMAAASAPANSVDDQGLQEAVELGTYLDGQSVLLRYVSADGAWFRMTPRSALHVGDRLLALPAFNPQITLASGLHLKLSGGTQVTLETMQGGAVGANRSVPVIDVAYGQVVIVNTANQENDMRLKLGTTAAQVRLSQNSTVALEVTRSYVPGRDPRQSASPMVVHVYTPNGSISWDDGSGARTIAAPSRWTITDGIESATSAEATFPEWIDQEPAEQRSEQLYGAPVVEQTLVAARPIQEQLLELYQGSRRREVKSLVARSSVYVGLFVPFVEALRDSEQRSTWKTHIETLRSAMALGPDSANEIWKTLVEQRGEPTARDLYEMLCGYSPEQVGKTPQQISAGAIPRLVDWLENDSLDYRVLAVQNLAEITGKRLMPNPAGSPTERAQGVRRWRERLTKSPGELIPPAG